MSLIRAFARALLRPTRPLRPVRLWRVLGRLPGIFDVVSMALQLRDLRRVDQIAGEHAVDNEHHVVVQDYNASVTQKHAIHSTRRAEVYYQILDMPPRDLSGERLLIVGPRNILEFYIAWTYGFTWKLTTGIDLYSTNPKIVVMNMEAMTFPEGSFDAVAMSATLAYAQDIPQTLAEVWRVLSPGGRFSFGQTYTPDSKLWPGNDISGAQIKQMLDSIGFRTYYYEPVTKVNSLGHKQTSHNFGVIKPDPARPDFDRAPM
jgi:SAM-dependent methyltransferase